MPGEPPGMALQQLRTQAAKSVISCTQSHPHDSELLRRQVWNIVG